MPTLPWKSLNPVDPDREYLVSLTYLPLRQGRSLPRFIVQTIAVTRQLKIAKGLLGYSLLARPLSKRFWTLSAWRDEDALNRFAVARPHLNTMRTMRPYMLETKFIRWNIKGREIPPGWEDALTR
ncbi:MAG: DUF3291 domain-containing protein [Candidatus Binataceae bacterium]